MFESRMIRLTCLLTLLLISSCTTVRMPYSNSRIEAFEKKGYQIRYNNEPVAFKYIYPYKRNVKSVIRDKQHQFINITSKSPDPAFNNVAQLVNDIKGVCGNTFDSVVFNGVPYELDSLHKLQIESEVRTGYVILTADVMNKMSFCKQHEHDFLIIYTIKH